MQGSRKAETTSLSSQVRSLSCQKLSASSWQVMLRMRMSRMGTGRGSSSDIPQVPKPPPLAAVPSFE
jgi:hypothetical protein